MTLEQAYLKKKLNKIWALFQVEILAWHSIYILSVIKII